MPSNGPIKCHQMPSNAIKCHQMGPIECHQMGPIKCHQMPSNGTRRMPWHPRCALLSSQSLCAVAAGTPTAPPPQPRERRKETQHSTPTRHKRPPRNGLHRPKKDEKPATSRVPLCVVREWGVTGCQLLDLSCSRVEQKGICVSLSMIFQASRFSASGRRVPLEPRRSEACRSCQPMHVLSFGEGRSLGFCVPVRVRQPAFGKCEPASWWSLV